MCYVNSSDSVGLDAVRGRKGEMCLYVLFYFEGQLALQLPGEHGGRPKMSSCSNAESTYRALMGLTCSQKRDETGGAVPSFTI